MNRLSGKQIERRFLGAGMVGLGGLGLLVVGCGDPAPSGAEASGGRESGAGGSAEVARVEIGGAQVGGSSFGGQSEAGGAGGGTAEGSRAAVGGAFPSAQGGSQAGPASGGRAPQGAGGAHSTSVWGPEYTGTQRVADKLDLLFVIDNSVSMADKQEALAQMVPRLVRDLVNPQCLDMDRRPAALQPATGSEECPLGTRRAMKPILDMHVGAVSSSLGGHGGAICTNSADGTSGGDDKGELLAPRRGLPYADGFLTWTGTESVTTFHSQITELIRAAGENGCGYEATNEAWYRFLVDPEPPERVERVNLASQAQGINATVLKQRAAFLRPDSAVMVVVLSDENDCSLRDDGYSWLLGEQGTAMPKARAICAVAPNDPCCAACADGDAAARCGTDSSCTSGTVATKVDNANLRCLDQKRRFGMDLLYPIDRYVNGLTALSVPNRAGELVPNPLYVGGRDPSLVSYVPIVGVPWQDLAESQDPTMPLRFKSADQLEKENAWPALVGQVDNGIAPLDPFMQESVDPRSGTSPLFGGTIQPPTSGYFASPVNGHERTPASDRGDLQYACVFPLATPRDCNLVDSARGCDCRADKAGTLPFPDLPLCQAPSGSYGTTQYFGKAYPGIRHLEIARRLGSLAVPASICPRNASASSDTDSGLGGVLEGMKNRLEQLFFIPLT